MVILTDPSFPIYNNKKDLFVPISNKLFLIKMASWQYYHSQGVANFFCKLPWILPPFLLGPSNLRISYDNM